MALTGEAYRARLGVRYPPSATPNTLRAMASVKLDGPGTQKLRTLEESLLLLQGLHGLVERMAIEVKSQKPIGVMALQLKRTATPLQSLLKGQFGMVADLVSTMILAAGRGGTDVVRLRTLREYIGQIRTSIEFNMQKVKEQHAEPSANPE